MPAMAYFLSYSYTPPLAGRGRIAQAIRVRGLFLGARLAGRQQGRFCAPQAGLRLISYNPKSSGANRAVWRMCRITSSSLWTV
jgi:hypothetical protein